MPRVESIHYGVAYATECVAGRAVACGSQVVVPVVRIGARIAGAHSSTALPNSAGLGGSGSAEFVAAWIRGEDGRVQWLPRHPSPPEKASDWREWLAQETELQAQIEAAARKLELET